MLKRPVSPLTFARALLTNMLPPGFLRPVSVLVSGAVLAQLVTFAALPLLTRLFTPHDFSLLAVFVAVVYTIGGIACLRLEIAVPLPADDEDARGVMALALLACATIAGFLAVPVTIAPQFIAENVFRQPQLAGYLWLMPIGIFSLGAFGAFQMWFVRKGRFTGMSTARVIQAVAAAGMQIGAGYLALAPLGLFLGPLVNTTGGVLLLGALLGRDWFRGLGRTSASRVRRLLSRYKKLPTLSTFEALSNAAATQLPMLIIAAVAVGPEAGHLILAITVMQAPIGLIGSAISQVYTARMSEAYRSGDLGTLTAKTLGALMRIGVGPILFAGIVAPHVFGILFGAQWGRSGALVIWMTPWMIAQFLALPIGMAYHATNNQALALGIQFSGFLVRVVLVIASWMIDVHYISETFSLSGFLFYVALLLGVLHCTSVARSDLLREISGALPIVALWALLGAIVTISAPIWPS